MTSLAWSLPDICGMGLSFRIDGFRAIFAVITLYMWIMTSLFSREYMKHARRKGRYYFFLWLTFIGTMGVFISNDFFTVFVFFEIMSTASYVCVIHDEKPDTLRAGGVYLAVAVIGGLVSLMGIFLLYHLTGTLTFSELKEPCLSILQGNPIPESTSAIVPGNSRLWLYIAGACIVFGFGAKAGMFPLHIWLPMAHPVAPAPASALLSGIITKTGIFGILILTADVFTHDSAWGFVMCLLGVVTMLLGGILAVFSVDLKRTLACSSMSQLGMIINGIGMQGLLGEENALAVRGSILHMINHSNLKLVLFLAAGAVVMNLHQLNLNEIRGYGRKKPLLKTVFLLGALGIGGIPGFNGYISKTLLHESIVEYIELLHAGEGWLPGTMTAASGVMLFKVIEWLFLLTGGLTVAYMTKLFICVFIEKNADPARQASFDASKDYCTPLTAGVLALSASVLPVFGLFSGFTLNRLADLGQGFLGGLSPAHPVHYFAWANLSGGLISIGLGALLYVLVIRRFLIAPSMGSEPGRYLNRWPGSLDLLTLIYEPLLLKILPTVLGVICSMLDGILDRILLPVIPVILGFFSKILDFLLDGFLLLLRKTTHRQLREAKIPPSGYYFSYYIGSFMNTAAAALNRTLLRRRPIRRDFILQLAEQESVIKLTRKVITASTAFSLMMFGIGMVAAVIYLLLV